MKADARRAKTRKFKRHCYLVARMIRRVTCRDSVMAKITRSDSILGRLEGKFQAFVVQRTEFNSGI